MPLARLIGPTVYPVHGGGRWVLMVREASPPDAPKPRLLDRVREALRTRHYSRRTEEAYVAWIRRYIFFHGKRHPAELGGPEVTRFLSSVAVEGQVAASTQNQALSALCFSIETCWASSCRGWTASCAPSGRSDSPSSSPATRCVQSSSGSMARPG